MGPPAIYGGRPFLYLVILIILVAVYAFELAYPATPPEGGEPSLGTLALMGATIGARVFGHHEWWRIATSPFLHANALHLASNALVLAFACRWLEQIVGWRWTAAVYFLSGVGGAWFSVVAHPPRVIGVGASGAILGLLGALYVVSHRLGPGAFRGKVRRAFFAVFAVALLPVLFEVKNSGVDYAAHVAGGIVGAAVGIVAMLNWKHEAREPKFGFYAAFIGASCCVAAIFGVGQVVELWGVLVR